MLMKNPYYVIWSDTLSRGKQAHPKENWVSKGFFLMTYCNSTNVIVIIIWLRYLKIWIPPNIEINIFPGTLLNKFFEMFIIFWFPFIIINYPFILRKKRYNQIMEKYGEATHAYGGIYMLSSILIGFITVMLSLVFY